LVGREPSGPRSERPPQGESCRAKGGGATKGKGKTARLKPAATKEWQSEGSGEVLESRQSLFKF
jgi:hypothetical protein